jgi:hypothetical protein
VRDDGKSAADIDRNNNDSSNSTSENSLNGAASGTGIESRLEALRKRRSELESLSDNFSAPHADAGRCSPQADPRHGSADRRSRIELIRNRRRQLEARARGLLRGEGPSSKESRSPAAAAMATFSVDAGDDDCPTTPSSSSSSTIPLKRPRREEQEGAGSWDCVDGPDSVASS